MLRQWAWSPQLEYLRLPSRPLDLEIERNHLSEAALLARLGHVLASRDTGTAALARKHFEAALQLDPEHRMALEGLTRLGTTTPLRD